MFLSNLTENKNLKFKFYKFTNFSQQTVPQMLETSQEKNLNYKVNVASMKMVNI